MASDLFRASCDRRQAALPEGSGRATGRRRGVSGVPRRRGRRLGLPGQRLQRYDATVNGLDTQVVPVDQPHADERAGVRGIGLHDAWPAVPDHFGRIHVEKLQGAVGQDALFAAAPHKAQGCDQRGWER